MSQMICPYCWGHQHDPAHPVSWCPYCGGSGTRSDVQLSDHFMLSELLRSDVAIRNSIPNYPTATQVDHLKYLATQILEPIREKFGPIHINSGLRLPDVNKALGGSSKTSAHMDGWAADIIPLIKTVSLKSIVDWVIENKEHLKYDQVIYEGTWVHVGCKDLLGRVRGENLMMFGGQYSIYNQKDPRVV